MLRIPQGWLEVGGKRNWGADLSSYPYFCVSEPALLRLTQEVLHPVPNDATRRLIVLSIALLIDSEPFSDVSDVSDVASSMIRYDVRWQS